jgi:KaiC/GvpD/RAD55 family RecA-like ATPase
MVQRKVQVGEEFEMRLDLVNVARRSGVLIKIEGVIPSEFKVVDLPSFCSLKDGGIEMKGKGIGPFQVETMKLKLKVNKAGSYSLSPVVTYADDLDKMKAFKTTAVLITAQPTKPSYEILPGRLTTGYSELDRLLLGGIPEKYAVALAAPSCDERQLLIRRFLEAGAKAGEVTLYITCEASNAKDLAEQFQIVFCLVCSLQADLIMQNQPNVYKLKGIDNLTDIDIALTKFFRTLDASQTTPRRACIDLISDVLLQHKAVITRKWLSSLLPNLKSKGFTTLAVIDPTMHPPEEKQAILSLFDGEIRMGEKETANGMAKTLRILKLQCQNYLKDEVNIG